MLTVNLVCEHFTCDESFTGAETYTHSREFHVRKKSGGVKQICEFINLDKKQQRDFVRFEHVPKFYSTKMSNTFATSLVLDGHITIHNQCKSTKHWKAMFHTSCQFLLENSNFYQCQNDL